MLVDVIVGVRGFDKDNHQQGPWEYSSANKCEILLPASNKQHN